MTEGRDNSKRDNEVSYYKCPRCGFVNEDERWVRTHITVLTDHEHKGHDGHSDAQEVVLLDDEGVEVGQEKGCGLDRKADIRPEELPDDIAEKQRKILAAVLSNPSLQRTEIADILKQEYDYSKADPSYISQVVRKYFRLKSRGDQSDQLSNEGASGNTSSIDDELHKLNRRQKRAVFAVAIHQMTYEEIGNRIGEDGNYLGRISRENSHIVEHLRDEFFEGFYAEDAFGDDGDEANGWAAKFIGESDEVEVGNRKYTGGSLDTRYKHLGTRDAGPTADEDETRADGGFSDDVETAKEEGDDGNTDSEETSDTLILSRSELHRVQEKVEVLRRITEEDVVPEEEALEQALTVIKELLKDAETAGGGG